MFSSRFNFLALYYGTVLSFTFLCHNIYCFTPTNKVESLFFVGEKITVGRGVEVSQRIAQSILGGYPEMRDPDEKLIFWIYVLMVY